MKKSEAKRRKKKVMLIATLSTAAIIVGGLTFAWYTSQDSVTNTFQASGNFKTVVVENFTPPTNWQPGIETDKVVQVTNTGTIDAYTRVNLVHNLTYLAKGGATPLTAVDTDGKAVAVASAPTLNVAFNFTVNKDAIEATAQNYNDDTDNEFKYILITNKDISDAAEDSALYALKDKLYIPDNVVLYVKAAKGDSELVDGENTGADNIVETGYNYEFLGYATDADGNAYEITVTPNHSGSEGDYTQDPTYGAPISSSLNQALTISVYAAETKTLTLEGINDNTNDWATLNDIVTLNFYDNVFNNENNLITDSTAGDNWYYRNGYFYYNTVLESGATTKPLLKSVTFKDTFTGKLDGKEITDIVYKLTVENDSTQGTIEAAVDTFAVEDTNLNADTYKSIVGVTAADTP